ncbi:MAG: M56 family metallopeptidase [Gammaproteobacteria bacterium]
MNELLVNGLLTYLAHSTLLLGALWLLDRGVLGRDPVRRERLWRAALIVPIASAGLQLAAPQFMVADPVAVEYIYTAPVETAPAVSAPALAPASSRSTPTEVPDELGRIEPWQWLLGAWLALSTALLLRIAGSVVRGRQLLSDRYQVLDGAAFRELQALVRATEMTPVRLTASATAPSPLTLPGREICLPVRALTLPADELRGLLAHELAHVARGDVWYRLAMTLFCALLCVQPLNFVARRRLADCAELNADDWARDALGDGHPLARCLITVATWLEPVRAPAFGAAMAESDRGLLGRVRRLATALPESRGWRGRGAMALLLIGALAVPGLVVTASETQDSTSRSMSVSERDDGSMKIRSRGPDGRLSLDATGEFRFSDDERGIASLAPGKTLSIRTSDRKLMVRADADGSLSYEYELDGKPQPFDAAGREWLAGLIPQLLRVTGIQADERVARIHADGGVAAVLKEIELIKGDFVARRYFTALASIAGITGAERVRIYGLAGRSISSDFELRHTLDAFPLRADSSAAEAGALLAAAQEIGSDFELAQLLMSVASRLPTDDAVGTAFVATAAKIGSDFELRRALSSAANSQWSRGGHLKRLVEVSAEIGSDFEHAAFLREVLQQDGLDEAAVNHVLGVATEEVGSDHELLQVLRAAARWTERYPETRAAYERAARTLGDHEFGQAMRAISG